MKISLQNDILPLKNVLYRLALRITLNHAEAEDVVQETLIKVWNRREQWEQIDSIEAFCLTICRNLALDKTRHLAWQSESLDVETHQPADSSYAANPEEHTMHQDRLQLVRKLVDSLPEKQRTIMLLRETDGKSYKDIAAVMGITEEQVKVNLFRARQTIKQKYIEADKYGL